MNAEYNEINLGDISINNEVIKNIALKAATEINGVYGLRTNMIKKIWNTLTKKEPAVGVTLEFISASEVKLTLKIMIGYGMNIPHYAGIVQENVKKAVEYMTGLNVAEVAVKVVEVEAQKASAPKENPEKGSDVSPQVSDEISPQ